MLTNYESCHSNICIFKQLRYLVQTTSRLSTGTNPEGHYVCSHIVSPLCQNRTSLKIQPIKLVRSKVLFEAYGTSIKEQRLDSVHQSIHWNVFIKGLQHDQHCYVLIAIREARERREGLALTSSLSLFVYSNKTWSSWTIFIQPLLWNRHIRGYTGKPRIIKVHSLPRSDRSGEW